MATVQLEQHEFEIKTKVHPYHTISVPRSSKPYYINQVVFHGDMISYTLYVSSPGRPFKTAHRGEIDDDNMEDPIRVEAGEIVEIQFEGPMSCEVSLVCSEGKRDD